MQLPRPVGREAASRKYDILSALMAFALAGDRLTQRRVMRIMALITTRYNWSRDELCIGQREIARLWSVDERTVKREMAGLRAAGWLVQKRKGARGHLSIYGLDLERMLEDTKPAWPLIGEDFVERMAPGRQPQPEAGNVVPLRPVAEPVPEAGLWSRVQARLCEEDQVLYGAWFHNLAESGAGEGRLTLAAPSAFHASYVATHFSAKLTAAVRRVDPAISEVRIEV